MDSDTRELENVIIMPDGATVITKNAPISYAKIVEKMKSLYGDNVEVFRIKTIILKTLKPLTEIYKQEMYLSHVIYLSFLIR